ncbi:phenylacetate-CoA oxygenase subunit PaaJ [Ginsengibacter hankyongi]|uniref:Phenylacetate-CoA oxygenase subunit PaaJ n=1 Tax=Ginsengibacter hankyongi TaxID=2607284 RepID=A0A5J5IPX9_9BACT|nr:1,2-phenylacetyl-CoA epoxidase subunit PaaD [Ginsengibacter hankyongi]KAA9042077.1 phenylacetate-CoA oxygenase subunit PaaJ [Ginsengibacter hankyongi]
MEETKQNVTINKAWKLMEDVYDPEIPVLSIIDLGIVRDIQLSNDAIEIFITPTYSGCPVMDVISMNIRIALTENGFKKIKITQQLSPAWTTDWMIENGKEKLKAYGITPPIGKSFDKKYLEELKVECPHCHSLNTKLISQFGSTACKALYQCNDCLEPFDYFKCH